MDTHWNDDTQEHRTKCMAKMVEWMGKIYESFFVTMNARKPKRTSTNPEHLNAAMNRWKQLLDEYLPRRNPDWFDFQLVGMSVMIFTQCLNHEIETCEDYQFYAWLCDGHYWPRMFEHEVMTFVVYYFREGKTSAIIQ